MTQPRGKQIKSVNTRYDVLSVSVVPGSAETVISSGSFPSAPGGADQDVPARVFGTTVSPYAVLAGYTMSIGVDGAPPFSVVFASTDTTVGRVCLKINAAAGSNIASNDAGHLVLTSPTVGSASSLILADVTPGVLSLFGLSAGTHTGFKAGTDGIITLSPDGLGGTAPHATDDGKNLVTDGGKLVYFSHINGFSTGRKMMQLVPGGVPVVGRLTFDGTSYHSKYYAKITPRAKVRSLGSFFSLLDGSNTLTLNVNGQGFNITFSAGPYTRDTVLDAINAAYASAMGITDPWARVDGTSPGPFRGLSGTSFSVEVDGGAAQVVTFTTESTATEVANHITASLVGATASVISGPNSQYVAIRSSNGNGRTSSLKIYSGDQSLFRLGIRPGFYGGTYVADQYGPDEIEIASVYRGDSNGGFPSVSVSGSGTTLVRMGLSAMTVPGSSASQYEPVTAPFFDALMSTTPFSALMCFPNVLEFGDVPVDNDTVIQRYLAKSAGSNIDGRNRSVDDAETGSITTISASRGFFDVGKPIVMASDGQIPLDNGGGDSNAVDAIVKQITRLSATEVVQAVAAARIETPGNGGNPLPTVPFMDLYADPTNSYSAVARGFRFFLDPSTVGLVAVDDPTGTNPLLRSYLALVGSRSIYFPSSPGRISDVNIVASEVVNGYMPLSSGSDQYLKVGGKLALSPNAPGMNLLRKVNAQYEIYLGDGTNSFGDFSGSGSLKQARDFLVSVGASSCKIVFHPGTYNEPASVDFSGFENVMIDGLFAAGASASAVTLQFGFGSLSTDGIISSTNLKVFSFNNIEVLHATPGRNAIAVLANRASMEGCTFHSPVQITNAMFMKCYRSQSDIGGSLAAPTLHLIYRDSGVFGSVSYADVQVLDCSMSSGQNAPVVQIDDLMGSKRVIFRTCLIDHCVMTPGNATVSHQVIQSTAGIGVLGINPGVSAFNTPAGLVFENIKIRNTDIISGTPGGGTVGNYAPTAIFLLPSGAAGPASWSISLPGVVLNNVSVENVNVFIPNGSSFQTQAFGDPSADGLRLTTVCIAGVGIPYNVTGSPQPYFVNNVGVLEVKNFFIDCELGISGPAATCMITFFGDYQNPSGLMSDIPAGLLAFSGEKLRLNDVVTSRTTAGGHNPTLFLASMLEIHVDGFYEEPEIVGISCPVARLRIREIYECYQDLKNVHFEGNFQTHNFWNNGCILFEPMSWTARYRRLSNFSIHGFIDPLGSNIYLASSSFGASNTWAAGRTGGIIIESGYIGQDRLRLGVGTLAGYSGIHVDGDAGPVVGNITIRNVTIDSCYTHGIDMILGNLVAPVTVEDCWVTYCGNAVGYSGVFVSTENTTGLGSTLAGVNIRGNNVSQCSTQSGLTYGSIQINVRNIGTDGTRTITSVFGNTCDNGIGGAAYINSCFNYNTNLPTSSGAGVGVRGLETGYTGQTGSFAGHGDGRIWTPGTRTLFNDALLYSDFSWSV